jgi:general secretion pathway protein G
MALIIETGEDLGVPRCEGFTLVELLLVLFLVALLASLVAPVATKSVDQAKESALKADLQVLRKAIDDYYANTGRYPQSLSLLVEKRYIRSVPVDPLTDRATTWIETRVEDTGGGVRDVHSGAEGNASDGKPYHDW